VVGLRTLSRRHLAIWEDVQCLAHMLTRFVDACTHSRTSLMAARLYGDLDHLRIAWPICTYYRHHNQRIRCCAQSFCVPARVSPVHPPQATLRVFQVCRPLRFRRANLLGSCAFWNLGRHPHANDIGILVPRAPSPILTLPTVDVIFD